MRAYPIWVEVDSCLYKNKKSFGAKDHSEMNIRVGSSASNSHKFADVELTRKKRKGNWRFQLEVDGVVIKEAWFTDNNGRVGEPIEKPKQLNK